MWVDKPPLHVHMVLYPRWPTEEQRGPDILQLRWPAGPPPTDEAAKAAEQLREYLRNP
jgi:hypothetical protein